MTRKQGKRNIVFKLISLSLPIVFLVLVEVLLAIFGYGTDYSLFIPYDDKGEYLVFNPDASKAYFNNHQFATTGNQEPFRKKKDSSTVRIFVLGESTTVGYPYFHNGSFHRWLQFKLDRAYPSKKIEIINLSLTAVNSYTVYGFAQQLMPYQPDAVLIYTGHNEYYGAMGVGSTQILGSNPTLVNNLIGLKKLKIVELLSNTYQNFINANPSDSGTNKGTRMQRMVNKDEIPLNSDIFQKGIEQFNSNISKTFELFQKHNIPVYVGNLVSNEKDLEPFISIAPNDLPQGFLENFQLGEKAYLNEKYEEAKVYLVFADAIFSEYPLCKYYLGQIAIAQENWDLAKSYLQKAKELDGLRFRAPQKLNEILKVQSKKHIKVHLVDVVSQFEKNAPGSLIGDNLMTDHVHPNLKGFALMSEAFYTSLKETQLLSSEKAEQELTFEQLVEAMPITAFDSIIGDYRIHILKSSWPYNEPQHKSKLLNDTYEQQLAIKVLGKRINWRQAMDSLFAHYNKIKKPEKATRIAEALVLENPNDHVFYAAATDLNAKLGHMDKALFYAIKSFHLKPSYVKAKNIYTYLLGDDQPEKAKPFIAYCIQKNYADKPLLERLLKSVDRIVALKEELVSKSADIDLHLQIIGAYQETRNFDAIRKYIAKILTIDSKNEEALSLKRTFDL